MELATGSWRLDFLKAADLYLPREATLMPLDWATIFDTPAGQRSLHNVRSGRKLLPIVWAHHDDRTYIGRPYTPYVNFATLLKSSGGSGFGIIHWTTRPLDLYFKSTVTQVWKSTENQPLEQTCEDMAVRTFGEAAREAGRDYLFSWLTEAPMFGRETSDRFIDVPLTDAAAIMKKSRARSQLLARIDPQAGEHLAYFKNLEEFIYAFFQTHSAFERAKAAAKLGEFDQARKEMNQAKPEEVIRAYVRAAKSGTITGGEKALVVSLNLRWLPYYTSMRQAVGLEPVRVRIGKVEREPLAQGAGHNTFYFDEQGHVWRVLEPAANARELKLGGIMGDPLRPGPNVVKGLITVPLRPGMTEVVVP